MFQTDAVRLRDEKFSEFHPLNQSVSQLGLAAR